MRTLVTGPASEPVTLSELKAQLRIVRSNEDSLLNGLITAARRIVEKVQWRQLITATWDFSAPAFPKDNGAITIPLPPLQSITHLKYYDTADDIQTFSTDYYTVVLATNGPGIIQLVPGYEWPEIIDGKQNAVIVRAVCGYGDSTTVPETTKTAIKMLAAEFYSNRIVTAGASVGAISAPEWSNAVEALMQIETCRVRESFDLG